MIKNICKKKNRGGGVWDEKYSVSLKHVAVPESKEVLQENDGSQWNTGHNLNKL